MMTQATTEPWCTSSPAARSMMGSMPASVAGGRGAAGRKTEAGPRADRPEPAATIGGPWTRRGPISPTGLMATYPLPASTCPPSGVSTGISRGSSRTSFSGRGGARNAMGHLSRTLRGSGGKQGATAEQVEAGAAVHLPLQQLEAGDLALSLAVAPGRGQRGANRGTVLLQPDGERLHG